ncbi:MAG: Zn-ribbon domain-containing OB-fold protein [Desulfobacterales bacterium]|nr:Zn-ribbon domain-containing OB-fold protein [Desulfobacterales bacterium]
MTFEYIPGIPLVHPVINDDNRAYWASLKEHVLSVQKCSNCGLLLHPHRPMCPRCLSSDMGWHVSPGRGVVHTWVNFVYDRAGYPGIKCPYVVAIVELDEGVRLLSNIIDMDPADVYIGMPVESVFTDVNEELTLVHFKKREK